MICDGCDLDLPVSGLPGGETILSGVVIELIDLHLDMRITLWVNFVHVRDFVKRWSLFRDC